MWTALPAVNLENLIAAEPVERGLYIASGGREMVPTVLEKLVRLLDVENNVAETFHASEPRAAYASYRHWRRNSRIGQLIWVDSGNLFDPYFVAREARKHDLDPVRVLRTIKVGRPFTAFQFQQMLDRIPKPALWAPVAPAKAGAQVSNYSLKKVESLDSGFRRNDEGKRELDTSNAMWWTPLVIISDLMGLFYDPDLPEDALVRAFREFMIRLTFLRQRAVVLALLHDHVVPPHRHHLLPEILKLARRVSTSAVEAVSVRPSSLVAIR